MLIIPTTHKMPVTNYNPQHNFKVCKFKIWLSPTSIPRASLSKLPMIPHLQKCRCQSAHTKIRQTDPNHHIQTKYHIYNKLSKYKPLHTCNNYYVGVCLRSYSWCCWCWYSWLWLFNLALCVAFTRPAVQEVKQVILSNIRIAWMDYTRNNLLLMRAFHICQDKWVVRFLRVNFSKKQNFISNMLSYWRKRYSSKVALFQGWKEERVISTKRLQSSSRTDWPLCNIHSSNSSFLYHW